ncbi:MAG: DinB family protein, partial [Anaerolineales bacterium]
MNTVQLVHFSLSLAFEYLEQAVSDVTQEQANWLPPGKANSIGALYWHTIAYCDQLVHDWCMPPFRDITIEEWAEAKSAKRDLGMGQAPLRESAGWQERVVIACPPENPEDPYWDLRAAREGLRVDLPALHDYAHATAQTLLDWAASLTPEDLERVIPTPWGD